jgi:rod shape-determining protein MreB
LVGTKIGIDLGSSNTRVFVEGKGLVFAEPSVVVCDAHSGAPVAFGKEAAEMFGRTPGSLSVVAPMKSGAVSDYALTKHLLFYFIEKICKHKYFKPNVVVSMHGGLSKLEKRTILDVVYASGAAKAFFLDEPFAAAMGAGVPFREAAGNVVADIGGGTADVAVISMGRIAESRSIRTAGNALTEAIVQFLLRLHDVEVGFLTAQEIKHSIGGAALHSPEIAVVMNGKHRKTATPLSFEVNSKEIYRAMQEPLEQLAEGIHALIEKSPPEFMADIADRGILLTGGGANLYGIDSYLRRKLSLPVRVAENPAECVINGVGLALKQLEKLLHNGSIYDIESLRDYAE